VSIDPANRRVTRDATEITLEPKAFAVLRLLIDRAGDLVTREELLDGVWGHRYITPATLNRVMTLLRRAFDDEAENPRFFATVHGSGYRFIAAIDRVAPPQTHARARFGPPPIAQLPTKLEPLIGRKRELASLQAMLAEHRAVTVIGPGGMGKTQCALEAARLCSAEFPDGVWFYDLSPFEQAPEWLRAVAATLSVPTAGAQSLLGSIPTNPDAPVTATFVWPTVPLWPVVAIVAATAVLTLVAAVVPTRLATPYPDVSWPGRAATPQWSRSPRTASRPGSLTDRRP